jgi:hypothetical protein
MKFLIYSLISFCLISPTLKASQQEDKEKVEVTIACLEVVDGETFFSQFKEHVRPEVTLGEVQTVFMHEHLKKYPGQTISNAAFCSAHDISHSALIKLFPSTEKSFERYKFGSRTLEVCKFVKFDFLNAAHAKALPRTITIKELANGNKQCNLCGYFESNTDYDIYNPIRLWHKIQAIPRLLKYVGRTNEAQDKK